MTKSREALLRHLLLAGDRAAWALLGAGIGVRALTAHRQPATMANSAIRADVHQPFDVHRDFGAERAFDLVITLDHLTQLVHVGVGEIANAQRRVDARLAQDIDRVAATDAIDVRQTVFYFFCRLNFFFFFFFYVQP